MRISYGQSSILRCTIQLAYDRFFTSFNETDEIQQAIDKGGIIEAINQYDVQRDRDLNPINEVTMADFASS